MSRATGSGLQEVNLLADLVILQARPDPTILFFFSYRTTSSPAAMERQRNCRRGAPCSAKPLTLDYRYVLNHHLPQHRLYFFPLLHGHSSLRPVPGYFFFCVVVNVVSGAERIMFGNISRCRLIIGVTTDSQKSVNSLLSIFSVGCIWERLSLCSFSGSNARFQHN